MTDYRYFVEVIFQVSERDTKSAEKRCVKPTSTFLNGFSSNVFFLIPFMLSGDVANVDIDCSWTKARWISKKTEAGGAFRRGKACSALLNIESQDEQEEHRTRYSGT